MWQWTLNWNRIRDDLIIGSCPMTTADIERIETETGATALQSLQSGQCRSHFNISYEALRAFGETLQLAMVNTPMLDFDAPDQRRHLPGAVRSLHELLAAGHRVYLHCTDGLTRSPLTALAYLTLVERLAPDQAFSMIRAARPQSEPPWEVLEGCRRDLVEALRDYIMVRAYYLSQENPEDSSDAHWIRAEGDMIRQAFVEGRGTPRSRLDPSRSEMQGEILVDSRVATDDVAAPPPADAPAEDAPETAAA